GCPPTAWRRRAAAGRPLSPRPARGRCGGRRSVSWRRSCPVRRVSWSWAGTTLAPATETACKEKPLSTCLLPPRFGVLVLAGADGFGPSSSATRDGPLHGGGAVWGRR